MRAGAVSIQPEAARPAMQSKPMRRMDAIVALAYMLRRTHPGSAMFNSLYPRLKALAEGPRAEAALAAVAFAESSFFPIPPDVLLAPMALAKPARAWRYALIATVASVIGGMLGYAIGAMLFDTVGQWLVNLYGYGAKVDALKQTYAQWGWLVILIKGLTPIPYKLVTIVSGLLGYNFPLFVALSIVTRGAAVLHGRGRPSLVRRTAARGDGAQLRRGSRRIRGAGRRRLRDRDQGLLDDARRDRPAALASGEGAHDRRGVARHPRRGLDLSGARLSALRALPDPALRLLCRRAARRVDRIRRQPLGPWAGAGRVRVAGGGLCRQRRARRLPRRGRIPLVGGTDRLHRRPDRIARRQRPGQGRSIRSRSCAATRSSCGLPDCRWPAGTFWPALRSRSTRRLRRGFRAICSWVYAGIAPTRLLPPPGPRLRAPGRRLLWGRIKEGGRAVLRVKRAAAHSIVSPVRATPHPCPPPQEGAGALTPSILPKCKRL